MVCPYVSSVNPLLGCMTSVTPDHRSNVFLSLSAVVYIEYTTLPLKTNDSKRYLNEKKKNEKKSEWNVPRAYHFYINLFGRDILKKQLRDYGIRTCMVEHPAPVA